MKRTIAGKTVYFQCSLASNQQTQKLASWIEDGCPTTMRIIGYSNGCSSSYGNFHATLAELEADGTITVWRQGGDVRSIIREFKHQLHERRIRPGAVYLECDVKQISAIPNYYCLPSPVIYWVAVQKYGVDSAASRVGFDGIFYTDKYRCRVYLDWRELPAATKP